MKKSLGAHTIVFPTPVFIVGTYDAQGKPNAMAAAWGVNCKTSMLSSSGLTRKSRNWNWIPANYPRE